MRTVPPWHPGTPALAVSAGVSVDQSSSHAMDSQFEMKTAAEESGNSEPFPAYAFVPGGPWPHPSTGSRSNAEVAPISAGNWEASAEYRRGIVLFNAGYYWEAHEVWEGLWHAHGRRGGTADLIKGLIKLAAAGVKVRERQRHGVVTHARRAAASFESARAQGGAHQLGLDLGECIALTRQIADDPPVDLGRSDDRVVRVFSFRIVPDATRP